MVSSLLTKKDLTNDAQPAVGVKSEPSIVTNGVVGKNGKKTNNTFLWLLLLIGVVVIIYYYRK